jgi:hypothetical protein
MLTDAERYEFLKDFVANLITRAPKSEEDSLTQLVEGGYLNALNTVQAYIDQLDKD